MKQALSLALQPRADINVIEKTALGRWAEGVNRIAPRFRSLKTVDCGKQVVARNKPQTRYP